MSLLHSIVMFPGLHKISSCLMMLLSVLLSLLGCKARSVKLVRTEEITKDLKKHATAFPGCTVR